MRKRIVLLSVLVYALCVGARVADAQTPTRLWHIGFLGVDSMLQAPRLAAFVQGLRELGYTEGRNIVLEQRWAEGDFALLPRLAAELVAIPVDVIVTAAPPAVKAAMGATTRIPIVMIVHEPVSSGMAVSLARPGKNVTGIAFQDTDLSIKRLELLRQAVPKLTRVAILWNATGTDAKMAHAVADTAKAMGMQALTFEVRNTTDLPEAIASAKSLGAQAVVQLAAPFISRNRQLLIDALAQNSLPATCELRMYVADGCLMTYSANLDAMFRREAVYVDRILRGANPAELAIEQPREFELVINLKTAQALGLTIPPMLRFQANEVIQ
jgi:putative ABC transport system substrate-binding protein